MLVGAVVLLVIGAITFFCIGVMANDFDELFAPIVLLVIIGSICLGCSLTLGIESGKRTEDQKVCPVCDTVYEADDEAVYCKTDGAKLVLED